MAQEFTHVHDHERTDAKVGPLYLFLAVMGVTLVVAFVFTGVLFEFFTQRTETKSTPASPLQMRDELPPEPRLQVVPGLDWNLQRANEQRRLQSYGWVDETLGLAHIPIDRAIDLLVEEGLPTRQEQPDAGESVATAARPAVEDSQEAAEETAEPAALEGLAERSEERARRSSP